MHSAERRYLRREAPRWANVPGIRGHLLRGLHLTGTSLRILAKDPNLLAIPLLALVFLGFVWLLVAVSLWVLGFPPASSHSGFLYQELFVAYLVTYFLATYFLAAIVGAAAARFEGGKPTVSDGIRAANAAIPRLVAWSLVASTIGILARFASLRYDGGSRLVARVLGYTWPIVSVFVIPAIVLENLGPLKAFRRSRELLRSMWGPDQSGILGTGAVFALLSAAGLVPFLLGVLGDGGLLVLSMVYWLLLVGLWSVVHGILVIALYRYATTSEASFGFSWQALNHPWVR